MKIKMFEDKVGSNSAWMGASILASLPIFEKMLITRDEHEEVGPTIVHMKCL